MIAVGQTDAGVDKLEVRAYEIPTDFRPEQDGSFTWDSTTINVVLAHSDGTVGIGFTYGDASIARLIDGKLTPMVVGRDALSVRSAWQAMVESIRNEGYAGHSMMAVAAVDTALWDLKARVLGIPLVTLLDGRRDAVPAYGSGGFTSYPVRTLQEQLGAWAEQGFRMVKMKVGRRPEEDVGRVLAAREAIGDRVALFVDANGAYERKEALGWAARFSDLGVSWLEEPVTSEDLAGLRLVRTRAPGGMDIAAGEYGFNPAYFARMIHADAVDVIQPDVTRCGGITGLLAVGGLCHATHVPISGHTAPSIHAHALCAPTPVRHLEYFHDHARIENLVFDGVIPPVDGALRPDKDRPGLGLELKDKDVEDYLVFQSGA